MLDHTSEKKKKDFFPFPYFRTKKREDGEEEAEEEKKRNINHTINDWRFPTTS